MNTTDGPMTQAYAASLYLSKENNVTNLINTIMNLRVSVFQNDCCV